MVVQAGHCTTPGRRTRFTFTHIIDLNIYYNSFPDRLQSDGWSDGRDSEYRRVAMQRKWVELHLRGKKVKENYFRGEGGVGMTY